MSIYANIRSALTARLLTLPLAVEIAWDNVGTSFALNETFIRPYLMMGEPAAAGIGDAAENNQVGVYQISLFSPRGIGEGDILSNVDAIVTHFKRGEKLSYGGITVNITRAYPGSIELGDFDHTTILKDWIHIPVTIGFYSFTPNT